MFAEAFTSYNSLVHRCDPRVRIIVAIALSIAIALAHSIEAQVFGLGVALGLAIAARLPLRETLLRLVPLNCFLALLWILVPLTANDASSVDFRPFDISVSAVWHVLGITLRANAIVIIATALIATLEVVEFGRAMHALGAPPKLVTLLLFTVRYTAVLRGEYTELRRAMRVRCFTPRTNLHTLRSLGNLVGMLLVRGFERSERVLMAMKCRGYTGKVPLQPSRPLHFRDAMLGAATFICLCAVLWIELV